MYAYRGSNGCIFGRSSADGYLARQNQYHVDSAVWYNTNVSRCIGAIRTVFGTRQRIGVLFDRRGGSHRRRSREKWSNVN